MSVVVYLRTDPYHVSIVQGVRVVSGTFVPVDQADDRAERSIEVLDGHGDTVASFARDEVVGYYIQPGRTG